MDAPHDESLAELYIPLHLRLLQSKGLFLAFLQRLGRSYVFSGPKTMLPEQEMAMWARWAGEAFIPANGAIAELIQSKQRVLRPIPHSFTRFLAYHKSFRDEFERWVREGGEYRHPGNFPQEFEEDVERRLSLLLVAGHSGILLGGGKYLA
jgi:hypothetical protein